MGSLLAPTPKICSTCQYWDNINGNLGECHGNPPSAESEFRVQLDKGVGFMSSFPLTDQNTIACSVYVKAT